MSRALAAWTAASLSAIPAAPSTISSPTGTILVYNNRWQAAVRRLHSTNNFPEFTVRICHLLPAKPPAYSASISHSFYQAHRTIHRPWLRRGWNTPSRRSTPRASVAVVGSGPAGLAAAQQLRCRRATRHRLREERSSGGLLRYGIPNWKRRSTGRSPHSADEGRRRYRSRPTPTSGVNVSVRIPARTNSTRSFCSGGAEDPRDLPIAGRELKGIHYAMEFLPQQNHRQRGSDLRALCDR